MMAMRNSLLPLAVRTIPPNLIDVTAHLNADSYLFSCFVGLIGIPGGTGSIFASRLSTAWHVATSATPRNTPTASADTGVFIAQSRHPRHNEPSPRTVMLALLLVALPVGLVYLLVLRISAWLTVPFTFSMLALIFLCIAVRLPSPFLSTHLPLDVFFCRSPCRCPRHISLPTICPDTGTTRTCMCCQFIPQSWTWWASCYLFHVSN
jgi:hypothetical protein